MCAVFTFFFSAASVRELWSLFNFWLKFEGKIFWPQSYPPQQDRRSFDSAQTSQQNKLPSLGSFLIYFYDFGSMHSLVAPSILSLSVSLMFISFLPLYPPSPFNLYLIRLCVAHSVTVIGNISLYIPGKWLQFYTKRVESNTSMLHKCLMCSVYTT